MAKFGRGILLVVLALVLAAPAAAYSRQDFARYVWRAKNGEFEIEPLNEWFRNQYPLTGEIWDNDQPVGRVESCFWQFQEGSRRVSIGMASVATKHLLLNWFVSFHLEKSERELAPNQYLHFVSDEGQLQVARGYSGSDQAHTFWQFGFAWKQVPTFYHRRDGKTETAIFFEQTASGISRLWLVYFD
ncbi:MAG: hypothetical protein LBG12_11685 [Synergistaceae bacterium]|nr:hypothetical protein [Synergistaceae bacterium]